MLKRIAGIAGLTLLLGFLWVPSADARPRFSVWFGFGPSYGVAAVAPGYLWQPGYYVPYGYPYYAPYGYRVYAPYGHRYYAPYGYRWSRPAYTSYWSRPAWGHAAWGPRYGWERNRYHHGSVRVDRAYRRH